MATVEQIVKIPATAEIGAAAANLPSIMRQRDIDSKAPTQLLRASINLENGKQELLSGVTGDIDDDPGMLVGASVGKAE